MKRDKSRLRQKLQWTEKSRWVHLRKILAERGPLRRGAFITIQRKCGKPNCWCATAEGHPAKCLSVKEGGRTRMIYIPEHLEVRVAKEARHYRRFRKARAELAKLSRQSLEVIDDLEKTLETVQDIDSKKKKRKRMLRKPHRKRR